MHHGGQHQDRRRIAAREPVYAGDVVARADARTNMIPAARGRVAKSNHGEERKRRLRRITQQLREFGGHPFRSLGGGSALMGTEVYRVIHWVGITALVVWSVYSAYSAFSFS